MPRTLELDEVLFQRLKNLRVVVLRNPYEMFSHKIVRDLFSRTAELKIEGYLAEYDHGVKPFGESDLYGDNILICELQGDELYPLAGYKSEPYSICKKYGLTFGALEAVRKSKNFTCEKEIQKILESCDDRKIDISYDCCWTAQPSVRATNKRLTWALKEMIIGLTIGHHRDYEIPEWITCGITRMKTHHYFLESGLTEISSNPVFQHPSLHGEEAVMVHLKNYNDFARTIYNKYEFLWKNQIEISSRTIEELADCPIEKLAA